jgi:hypothetical protein
VRAEITRALITQKGFNIVAVEADWPDAYRAKRFVRHVSEDTTAADALADFRRFPRAIGVIYRPQTERLSHYFTAELPRQFDLVLHIDRTHAIEPLERWARVEAGVAEPIQAVFRVPRFQGFKVPRFEVPRFEVPRFEALRFKSGGSKVRGSSLRTVEP